MRQSGLLPLGDRRASEKRLFRRQNHHNPAALHRGVLLHLSNIGQFLGESRNKLEAFVDVGVLAATEDDRADHFVAVFQKLTGTIHFGHEVVLTDLGAEADFFVLAVVCMPFVEPFLLLIFELSKVHNSADRGIFAGGDLD